MMKLSAVLVLMGLGLSACSTADKGVTGDVAKAQTAKTEAAHPATVVKIKCINQDFSDKSTAAQYENKFVIIPYKKLKTPGKEQAEKDIDETEDLYFDRVSKMAEKTLVDAGLQKADASDKKALIVALGWNTKKNKLGWKESAAVTSDGKGQVNVEKLQKGEVYLSHMFMKAVAPNKKTTRWQIDLESINTDTFYLNVLPQMFVAGKEYVGKNCNSVVEKTVASDSPDVVALRNP